MIYYFGNKNKVISRILSWTLTFQKKIFFFASMRALKND